MGGFLLYRATSFTSSTPEIAAGLPKVIKARPLKRVPTPNADPPFDRGEKNPTANHLRQTNVRLQ